MRVDVEVGEGVGMGVESWCDSERGYVVVVFGHDFLF